MWTEGFDLISSVLHAVAPPFEISANRTRRSKAKEVQRLAAAVDLSNRRLER